jgi:hypothetical protein
MITGGRPVLAASTGRGQAAPAMMMMASSPFFITAALLSGFAG